MRTTIIRALFGAMAFLCALTTAAASERATQREARAMFDRAVKFLEEKGPEQALAAFSERNGAFVKKDLYIFVIDQKGVYRANGAAPDLLIGLNVLDTHDAAGTPLFRNMIEAVRTQSEAAVRYVWLNRQMNKVESKVTYLHRNGEYILGVGYFAPRATPEEARSMLQRAVTLVQARGMGSAAASFNNPHGNFVRNDLYVFAVNLESGKFEAMGMNPKLANTDARGLHDVEGHPMVEQMIELAKGPGEGAVDYMWRNPVTNAVEKKYSLIRRVGDSLVGVGYYRD